MLNSKFLGTIGVMTNIGGNTKDPVNNPLQLSESVMLPGGYLKMFKDKLLPLYQAGFRVFVFHRPYGEATRDSLMDFESVLALRQSKYSHVETDLYEMLDYAKIHAPDATFILYLGTHSKHLDALLDSGKYDEHFETLVSTVRELINRTNVSIAIDQMPGDKVVDSHPMAHFIKWLRSYLNRYGNEVFLEPMPRLDVANMTWHLDFPAFTSAGMVHRHSGPDSFRRQPNEDCISAEFFDIRDGEWEKIGRPSVYEWLADEIIKTNVIPIISRTVNDSEIVELLNTKHDTLVYHTVTRAVMKQLFSESPKAVQPTWHPAFHRGAAQINGTDAGTTHK